MNFYEEAAQRIPTQRQKIIELLKDAGADGVNNKDLVKVSLQYSARIHELVKSGFVIDIERTDTKGVYKYILRKMPAKEKFYDSAENEILNKIEKEYGGSIGALELKALLIDCNFHIKRKANWFKDNMRSSM